MRYRYLMYIIALLFFTQCNLFSSDDDNSEVTCLIDEITYDYVVYQSNRVFTYNEQNQVIRVQGQDSGGASWFSDYYYDNANIIRSESSDTEEVTIYSFYSWSPGQLEIENMYLLNMSDNEMIQALLDSDNNLREYSIYTYDPSTESWDNESIITGSLSWNEGNIIEIERIGGYNLSHKYEGINNNLQYNRAQYAILNKGPVHSNTKNTNSLTIFADYDNNKNPFYYSGYSNTQLRFGVNSYTPTYLSKNNPTKITYTYGNNEPVVYTYEYTYNEYGYPDTVLEKREGNPEDYSSIWELTYNCLE